MERADMLVMNQTRPINWTEAVMKPNLRSLIFPLLSTLFFLVILFALNTFYEPLEFGSATPLAPMSVITRGLPLGAPPTTTTALSP
jgi:hypothetical protein